ncbi:MAG: hypothetical protein QOJ65_833, partial [Fimbriimonadaceae bacterium]|nr:hypothetical protein [Fimbriimonadaceae bacterium]
DSHAGVAQWLERRPVTPEAAGSSPVIRAIITVRATVAQSVEHSTENARVAGSIPACGTTSFDRREWEISPSHTRGMQHVEVGPNEGPSGAHPRS